MMPCRDFAGNLNVHNKRVWTIMKNKKLLSTVLTPIPVLETMSAVASAYDGCSIESDPETQSAGDPLSCRLDDVLANDKSALLLFHSGWCPYCHQQMPIIGQLEGGYAGSVTFIRINVTARPDHAKEFGVSALPTMIIIRGTDEDGYLREEPFNNTGTVNITGTAVIRVLNSTGDAADEFRHNDQPDPIRIDQLQRCVGYVRGRGGLVLHDHWLCPVRQQIYRSGNRHCAEHDHG